MGATRLCFLLFCLFLVSVSSVRRTTVNNNCLQRPPQAQGRNRIQSLSRYHIWNHLSRNHDPENTSPPPAPCTRPLNDINDLINTGYGRLSPRHGLQLLFWFAQRVNVNQNYIRLNFNPTENNQNYGFHYFGNRVDNGDTILPSLSSSQVYYSVGNLNSSGATKLPEYVWENYRNTRLPQGNMDRLMVSFNRNTPYNIHRVFITAHNLNRNNYNHSETYEINPGLILQIRETYCKNDAITRKPKHYDDDNDDDKAEERACRRFLTHTKYSSNACTSSVKQRKTRSPYPQCNTYEGIKLEIKTSTQGYLKLIWDIPAGIKNTYKYVYIDICQNSYSSGTNEDPKQVRKNYFQIYHSSGALDTSVSLNAGLQPRLRLYTTDSNYYLGTPVTWYGPEFDGANRVIPIRIKGSDASLQLYANYGKACARLYIKKTFSNWKDVLYYSWVGFYKSSQDKNDDYYTYEYAEKFALIDNTTTENYDIYQYDSSLPIAPGVQIRFLLDKKYDKVLAQTTPWESDETTSTCDTGNLQPDPSSLWSFPEFFYEPGYYDANNVIPSKIMGYDVGLQLLTQDGKACARLYIKKTFKDWNKTFYYSWVGFYTSSQKANKKYCTYQYAVNFNQMEGGAKHFDIYQYKSELPIASGVQLRFLKDKGYDEKLGETKPWSF